MAGRKFLIYPNSPFALIVLMEATKESVLNYLRTKYEESDLQYKVEQAIPDFLDSDWEDEFEDEAEAYQETGRGEAESQVRMDIERDVLQQLNLPTGSSEGGYEKYCELIGEDIWTTIFEVYEFLDAN